MPATSHLFSEVMSLLAYYIKERLRRPLSASVAYQDRERVKKHQHRRGDHRDKGKQYQSLFDAACVDVEHQLARAFGCLLRLTRYGTLWFRTIELMLTRLTPSMDP